ncbi:MULTISPECIES: hypothetical protein [unclassified Rhizobium]|uniref:hypothetical protein n=1 Tax=unclassified Rhizobium TaxID=2613769 RepID=UPI001610FEBC|nr:MULTISPECIES: hypothetical protein [unclassified Rhizobium]MBB3297895.1 hypothetical protein [Rhizobium sp. BK112]MBB4177610.1 hypothetical protein [Rhizobium sp. BK109]
MNLLNLAIAAAGSAVSAATKFNAAPRNLAVQAKFNYGSGGTSVDVYLQTSLDGGQTWIDIANFHFTTSSATAIFNLSAATPKTTAVTPTDGSLAANTCVDGILGAQFRTKVVSVGTYAGSTTIAIDLVTDQAA